MLLSAGLPLPERVFGHGFLTKEGLKMGKSLGNTLDPQALVRRCGSDAVRYFLLRDIEFGRDGDFSEERFINIVNANLANTIGNLLNRTLGLLKKNCGACVPVALAPLLSEKHPLALQAAAAVETAQGAYEELRFAVACEALLELAGAGNVFLEEQQPWALFKKGRPAEDAQKAATALAAVLEVVRIVAVALSPVTPALSRRLYAQLGFEASAFEAATWGDTSWGGLQEGQRMADAAPVFQRIEPPLFAVETQEKGGVSPATVAAIS
eukprot:TRINITY_DN4689_c0_g1_i1.p1 TRINITY_DN4689_c0_g1~~TRINITY_DN4689_c0_g1_i1.p1  ORF type:complete len:267 (+),score=76.22 TRINITY_DN4689_c0_g1_i1:350-1150(+)